MACSDPFWFALIFCICSIVVAEWANNAGEADNQAREAPSKVTKPSNGNNCRGCHCQNKKHKPEQETRRIRGNRKENRRKQSAYDDDVDTEFPTERGGRQQMRGKHDRNGGGKLQKPKGYKEPHHTIGVNVIRQLLTQLGQEFMSKQVSEDYVFGQYLGYSMKNLTRETKLKMQHDILNLIMKYQSSTRMDDMHLEPAPKENKLFTLNLNSSDDGWEFNNLVNSVV